MSTVTYAKVEFVDPFGAVIGSGRVRFMDRTVRESVTATIGGQGVELSVVLPVTDYGDQRAPYRLRLTME